MRDILHAKADYCPLFKSALIDTVGKHLVESTQDLFWASGLTPQYTTTTKPEYYPGRNELGRILESVRADLIKETLLLNLADNDLNNGPRTSHCSGPSEAPSTKPPSPVVLDHPSEEALTTDSATKQTETVESAAEEIPSQEQRSEQPPTIESTSEQLPPMDSASKRLSSAAESTIPDKPSSTVLEFETPINTTPHSTPSLDRKKLKAGKIRVKEKKGMSKVEITPTVIAMFEALKKRKMSPEKEADNSQDTAKYMRRNSSSS